MTITGDDCIHTGSIRNRDDTNKENEPEQIENPLVLRRKGRPKTKRYKSSTEKKPHAKYICGICGQSGHNSARCQNQ